MKEIRVQVFNDGWFQGQVYFSRIPIGHSIDYTCIPADLLPYNACEVLAQALEQNETEGEIVEFSERIEDEKNAFEMEIDGKKVRVEQTCLITWEVG